MFSGHFVFFAPPSALPSMKDAIIPLRGGLGSTNDTSGAPAAGAGGGTGALTSLSAQASVSPVFKAPIVVLVNLPLNSHKTLDQQFLRDLNAFRDVSPPFSPFFCASFFCCLSV